VRIASSDAVTLTNNTIADSSDGYGIEIDAADALSLTNNLIVGHAYGVYSDASASAWLAYNDVWGNSIAGYYGVTPGATDISADPDFVDSAAGDYHLGTCSGAVDAGTHSGAPLVDYDGDVRPVDGHNTGMAVTDIGADERLAVTAPLPEAGFTYVVDGRILILTNTSQNAVSYAWDFGDGMGTSRNENPTYAYGRPGTYTVTLAASCAFGCESTYQDVVEIRVFSIHLPVVVRSTQ
jgi:PKD repeat protein